jgi:hypothetical protein
MCPYEAMFGRKPRWEHCILSHLRQFSRIEEQSLSPPSESDDDQDSEGKNNFLAQ